MNKILILGGTGFVGRSLCVKLAETYPSAQIVVPSRHPERAKHLQVLPTLQLVQGRVSDPCQLQAWVRDCDAVVNLIAILHGTSAEFERTHVELPRKLAQTCAASGVRRLVHVSALGVPDAGTAPSRYLRSKAAGEAALKEVALDLTLLRPSVIFGEHDHFLNLFATLQKFAPVVPLAGAATQFQPVWVQDVAGAIVHALSTRSSIGKTYECAGPHVFTLQEIVQMVGRWSGHQRLVFGLPERLGRAQAAFMECLPGTPLMSRDNLDSMRVPNVATGRLAGLQALGITPTPMASVAPGYLSPGQGEARLDRWRAGHGG
jgi:uncharacterized protein YbjT (DUF2867 family)